MNKIISKILIIFIIAVILVEFSFSNVCNASGGIDSGTINLISNLIGGIISIILWIPKLIVTGTLWLTDKLMITRVAEIDGINGQASMVATPYDIFFNHYNLLSIDFFSTSTPSGTASKDKLPSIGPVIKASVAQWFYIIRAIALIILLVILIYVGIRMALSTVAEQKTKYKKMLFDWICSIILVFVLQYLAIFIIRLNNAIVDMIAKMIEKDELGEAISRILMEALVGIGTGSIMAFLVYAMITIQTFFFFIAYINRMLKVAFLIMISPLITITYSIDKMGDGKAQALNTWLKEFIFTILIQPFDCIMYLAFVSAAVSLLGVGANPFESLGLSAEVNEVANGFLAILCLKFINDGEKVIRQIFNFTDDNSSTSMAAGAAVAVMAMQKTQQMAQKTGKVAGGAGKFGKAMAQDSKLLGKFTNNPAVQKITETAKNVGQAIQNNPFAQKIQKTIKGFNKQKDRIFSSKKGQLAAKWARKSSALALASMSAAMMYASGSNGGLESAAAGINMYGALDKKFTNSLNSIAAGGQEPLKEMEEKSRDDLGETIDDMTNQLAEEGLSEEDMNDVDKLEEDANNAEAEANEARERALEEKTEEKDAERSALDTKIADMESALEGAKPEDKEKMAADLAALKAQREALGEEGTLSEKDVEEVDSREDVKEAREKYARAKSIAKTARERKNAMQTMADFDTKEAAMKRLEGYTRPIKDAELDAQANKILALIVEVQRQRKERTDEADTREENEITDKDYETADATTQHLVSAIRSSIARGSNFDVEEYINDHIGVDSSSRNSIGYFLASAVNEYKDLENKKAYYDRVVKPAKSLKIDGDDLKGRMYETAIEPNAERQERRAKHSG